MERDSHDALVFLMMNNQLDEDGIRVFCPNVEAIELQLAVELMVQNIRSMRRRQVSSLCNYETQINENYYVF